jgi:uncharacterized coiled-coil protein SlyX
MFLTISVAVIAGLLGIAVIWTFVGLNHRIDTQGDRLAQANSTLAKTNSTLAAAQDELANQSKKLADTGANALADYKRTEAGTVSDLDTRLANVEKKNTLLSNCLPELQNELSGVSVNTSNTNGWLTGAWITNGVQLSRVCAPVLQPAPSGG